MEYSLIEMGVSLRDIGIELDEERMNALIQIHKEVQDAREENENNRFKLLAKALGLKVN